MCRGFPPPILIVRQDPADRQEPQHCTNSSGAGPVVIVKLMAMDMICRMRLAVRFAWTSRPCSAGARRTAGGQRRFASADEPAIMLIMCGWASREEG